jgi:subtilisin family serine protease
VPAIPVRSGGTSLAIETGLLNAWEDDSVIPEGLEYLGDKLNELKASASGEGVTVAVLDSGIGENDLTGHGTKMSDAVKAAAPSADVLDTRVLDSEDNTSSGVVSDAVKNAVDNGARVLLMSFNLFPVYDNVKEAIDYAARKGAILVAAAGNEASEILDKSLAAQDNVITVGSVDADGKISAWSNYGSEIDLYAPWDVIEGQEEAGTSYSAAFVAGLAALILEDNPEFTADDVLAELKSMMPAVKKDAEVKKDADVKIKGVSVDEVVSLQDVLRKQKAEFTGTSVEVGVVDANMINN